MTKLTHPESKTEIEVDARSVPLYESQGWETKSTAKSPKQDDDK